jgi:hypothetical protein
MSIPLAFEWRHMLFANWAVDADVVDERLPDDLAVQTYDGDAWLSVLPFVNGDTRPRGLPSAVGVDVRRFSSGTSTPTAEGNPRGRVSPLTNGRTDSQASPS